MNIMQNIVEALESLISNKMRSSLTVLGIVIGVGAVIAMLGIGEGAQQAITGQIGGLGTNLIFVLRGGDENIRNPQPLTITDADALMDPFNAPSITGVAPYVSGNVEVSYSGESSYISGNGVTADYDDMRNITLLEGEFISEAHILSRAAVVVLGPDTAENLFGHSDGVIGETIRIEGQPFRVVGVTEPKGGSGFSNEDDQVWVPLSTAQIRLLKRPVDRVDVILVQAGNPDLVPQAEEEIKMILRVRHRTPIGQDDFTIFTQKDILDTASMVTSTLTIFLGGVAAISLLVGGIGIMNIMLVSVTERTREIGLRKAIGARKRDIMVQFLVESILLSLVGGIIGILLGYGITLIVDSIAKASDVALNSSINLNAILLATLFSSAVGLFFGAYPAKRAADLEPVEALRSE
ncbi:MAG: ABC transporter permease [Anaerolineales bacterium]|nr:ABC transporter permease [Anaerolineales bacterium]